MQNTKLTVGVAIAALLGLVGCGGEEESMGGPMVYPGASATNADTGGDDEGDDESDAEEDDDDGNEETDGGDDAADDSNADDDSATTGPSDDGPATTGPADSGAPPPSDSGDDPELMMCLDMAMSECEDCACMNCLSQLQACQADTGCVAIRMCAQQSGCTGIDCLGPCGDVIDANGGPFGPSAGLASTLSDCYTGSCPGC